MTIGLICRLPYGTRQCQTHLCALSLWEITELEMAYFASKLDKTSRRWVSSTPFLEVPPYLLLMFLLRLINRRPQRGRLISPPTIGLWLFEGSPWAGVWNWIRSRWDCCLRVLNCRRPVAIIQSLVRLPNIVRVSTGLNVSQCSRTCRRGSLLTLRMTMLVDGEAAHGSGC